MTTKYFVWNTGVGGKPVPELYYDKPTDGHNKTKLKDFLFCKKLDENENDLTFAQLKEKYPHKESE